MGDDFVVDNSVVMTWCFLDEDSQYTDIILNKLESGTAFVPSIWPLEVTNVLLVAERKRRISEADTTRFIALLGELPIIVDQESPERMMKDIFALARKHDLSSYDASYLDLAMRKGLPIATLDKNILAAAKRSKVSILKG
ncbi:type II toxin-antitoxin system VapC family toxin [Desulfatitalea alkaliphila]|uniref:Type II toxin-antitoxin system VapC family toxin n=1 Tax=Desulfatitalea alkaliphila TaxID=2929485 RepID=A0AA41R341_9BACT|nr:type II toxin-antitoxin system VapC family toxin [Desulfatitalea alkaliphila]MCJ8502202.1 type II toxin-antitoxin system VapC family toxin [Desulfatitalea alkaliphila]